MPATTLPLKTQTANDEPDGQNAAFALTSLARLTARGTWRLSLPHSREAHMLLWMTRGQARALVGGVRRGLGAGNVLWLPARTLFALDFGPQVLGQALTIQGVEADLLPQSPQHLRIRDVGHQGELTGLLDLVQRELRDGRALSEDALEAKFTLIQVWMRRMMLDLDAPGDRVHLALPSPAPKAHVLAEKFACLLEANFTKMRRAELYAAEMGITPTHLARVCSEVAGMSAADLLTLRTLHAARSLLADTKVPATQIASHLGFGSAAYFSRFILKHTGLPPSGLRAAS